jgi:group I intron endonuclease
MIIYKITNIINGKVYIGKTIQPLKIRWKCHCALASRNSPLYFHRAIRKYGCDKFSIEILKQTKSMEYLNFVEKYFIKKLNANNLKFGYNMTIGGDGVMAGRHHSEEAKVKISLGHKGQIPWMKGRRHSEETKHKISKNLKGVNNWCKGKKLSDEHKRKLVLARKGKPSPSKGTHWSKESRLQASLNRQGIGNSFYGKKHTEEAKQKMSDAKRGKLWSKERKLVMANKMKGRHHSEETKRKMQESALRRWHTTSISYKTN